jgi:acetate kinase
MAAILVFNAGSSSLKYRLSTPDRTTCEGVVERIGDPSRPPSHLAAFDHVVGLLADGPRPAAVGHRVVHGGSLTEPALIDEDVERTIERMAAFAPSHNPVALSVIRATRRRFPGVPQVAVFDTSFHASLPPQARTYAIDAELARSHGIRRFGFHGISVAGAVETTARLLSRPVADLNMVVLHLGNGASATAVRGGLSVDTSMGVTPLEGLVMGARSGDLDPALPFVLGRAGLAAEQIEEAFEHRSGLRGLCGDHDMRAVLARAGASDPDAELALAVYVHRLRKYIGAYIAVLGRVDAVVFTGGVGENAAVVRSRALSGLDVFGIDLDRVANETGRGARLVSSPDSRVAVCIAPADEESAIAAHTIRVAGV